MKAKILLGLAVLGLLIAGCAGGAQAPSDSAPETVTVQGYGEARGDPDMATLSLGINLADTDIAKVVQESNQQIAAITSALLELGIEAKDIQTTGFNVWPEDIWDQLTGQPTGEKRFHVDSTIQVNVRDITQVGKVLETALASGANNVYGLSFGMQDTSSLAVEARALAIADAQKRAQEMAQALGLSLGEITGAQDLTGGPVSPFYAGAARGLGGGGGEPPISEGQMAVSVSVSVTFQIER